MVTIRDSSCLKILLNMPYQARSTQSASESENYIAHFRSTVFAWSTFSGLGGRTSVNVGAVNHVVILTLIQIELQSLSLIGPRSLGEYAIKEQQVFLHRMDSFGGAFPNCFPIRRNGHFNHVFQQDASPLRDCLESVQSHHKDPQCRHREVVESHPGGKRHRR